MKTLVKFSLVSIFALSLMGGVQAENETVTSAACVPTAASSEATTSKNDESSKVTKIQGKAVTESTLRFLDPRMQFLFGQAESVPDYGEAESVQEQSRDQTRTESPERPRQQEQARQPESSTPEATPQAQGPTPLDFLMFGPNAAAMSGR